jgi:ABC-2 type transport system ATP-binding protein
LNLRAQTSKSAHTLSVGNQRKFNLALAFIAKADLYVLDDPTTWMDPDSKRRAWNLIDARSKTSRVIFSTQSMEDAESLSTRIGLINNGEILKLKTPLEYR